MKTKCPHLEEGRKMHMCNASDSLMVPSVYETTQYCTTERHCRCPILDIYTFKKSSRMKEIDVTA